MIAGDDDLVEDLAELCDGADGRSIRKLVVSALTNRESVARDPGSLTPDDLLAVFRRASSAATSSAVNPG